MCVIDCDLGQPEFTAPGLLSLHIIEKPVLSASHMNMKTPETAYYIGDLTSKNEPSFVLGALEKLFERYKQILMQRKERPVISQDTINSSNGFSALDEQYIDNIPPLPLLINTDGFIRYLGAEILTGITRRLQPTHILQLVTVKDKNIDSIDEYIATSTILTNNNTSNSSSISSIPVQLHSLEAGRASASRIAAVDLRSLR